MWQEMVIGNRDFSTFRSKSTKSTKSDSGNGDDASVGTHESSYEHPLARKGYDIGPAARLEIGDVFEFLWADSHEFEWEWKCLGYTRFIVLRHSDTFPHYVVCVPISTPTKNDFQKPGIDSSQQGYVFDENDRTPPFDKLPFSPVGMQLRPGKFRVKENSRANYADVLEIDHDAQVMAVGDVARYFDRVRRNVNKAVMRNVLKRALEQYRQGKLVGKKGAKLEASVVNGGDDDDLPEESDGEPTSAPEYMLRPDDVFPEHREPSIREPSIREPSIREPSIRERRESRNSREIRRSEYQAKRSSICLDPLISSEAAAAPPPPPPAPPLPPMDSMPPPPPPAPPLPPQLQHMPMPSPRDSRHADDAASIRSHASRERRSSRRESGPPRGEDLPRKLTDPHVDGASRPYRQRIELPRSRSYRQPPEQEIGSIYDVATARAE